MSLQTKIERLKQSIGTVMIGKDDVVELLVIALINKGHVLLESVPGTGKTMLAKSFATSIGGIFKRIQFTPDVLPSDVTGVQVFNPKDHEFELRPGPVMTNILLADEINRATPRTQSSLLEVMEERQTTIDGETIKLPEPFIVIATQNQIESQQGTFPLPEAQMDRFLFQIDMGYPELEEEKQILRTHRGIGLSVELSQVLSQEEILDMQDKVAGVTLSEDVEDYLVRLVRATRDNEWIELGVSPRGTLALMKAAQGKALLSGRGYVTPEDIKEMAPYVLPHRIVLSMEGALRKSATQVVDHVLSTVAVPVEAGVGHE